ncbi:hypothetical protein Gotri_011156 [Gossypium trilobum]|uniref:Uncharacterized protein n=1 Tax=Gossypium trilobum TaxID=34281 RepID=A0A7J9ESS6_9ROSI|nr:hypothetical protein [Gossypium trilobum]
MKIGNAAYSSFCWITICRISQLGRLGLLSSLKYCTFIDAILYVGRLTGHLDPSRALQGSTYLWSLDLCVMWLVFSCFSKGKTNRKYWLFYVLAMFFVYVKVPLRIKLTAKYHASKLVVIDFSRVLKAWFLAERAYLLG